MISGSTDITLPASSPLESESNKDGCRWLQAYMYVIRFIDKDNREITFTTFDTCKESALKGAEIAGAIQILNYTETPCEAPHINPLRSLEAF